MKTRVTRLDMANMMAANCDAEFASWRVVKGMMCAVYKNSKDFGHFEIVADVGASMDWPEHLRNWAREVPNAVQYVPGYCGDVPFAVMEDGTEVRLSL